MNFLTGMFLFGEKRQPLDCRPVTVTSLFSCRL